jgi:cyclopropane fatty-acyl-phospholipid synthase-like methyltransferase
VTGLAPSRPPHDDGGLGFQEWLVARSDASQHAGQAGATKRLATLLAPRAGERLLDLGCGSAKTSVYFAERHRTRTVAMDRAASSLARARRRRDRSGRSSDLALVQGDGLSLPFADAVLDVAVIEAVAYATPLPVLLGELRRTLRPGGRMGIVDIARRPGASVPHQRFQQLLGERTFNLMTHDQWARAVGDAGFDVMHAESFPIRHDLATLRDEVGDWIRSLPRQLAWLALSGAARRLFWANYRVGLDRGIEGCLVVAIKPTG